MPLDTALDTYRGTPLMPAYNPHKAQRTAINLAPSLTYPKGQLVVQVAAAANDVQTFSVSGTPTGGTLTLSGVNPLTGAAWTTAAIAFNAIASAVQSAIRAVFGLGSAGVAVTGGPLPGTNTVLTLSGALAGLPMPTLTANLAALTGGTPAFVIAHTTTGASLGTYGLYTGSGTVIVVNMYDCITDAAGNITYGSATGGDRWGQTFTNTPAYTSGTFYTTDLTGLDANAIASMSGKKAANNLFEF
jgi:hypothetical protein